MLKLPGASSLPQELSIITSLRYWRSSTRVREPKPFRMPSNPVSSSKTGKVRLRIRQFSLRKKATRYARSAIILVGRNYAGRPSGINMQIGQLEFLKHVFRSRPRVYLDHNATTSVSPHVRRTMNRILKNYYGNPSSLYRIATKSARIIEQARHRVADAIH